MADCPKCKTPGAYVGFNTIECRNPQCEHFKLDKKSVCPCCGGEAHLANDCPTLNKQAPPSGTPGSRS